MQEPAEYIFKLWLCSLVIPYSETRETAFNRSDAPYRDALHAEWLISVHQRNLTGREIKSCRGNSICPRRGCTEHPNIQAEHNRKRQQGRPREPECCSTVHAGLGIGPRCDCRRSAHRRPTVSRMLCHGRCGALNRYRDFRCRQFRWNGAIVHLKELRTELRHVLRKKKTSRHPPRIDWKAVGLTVVDRLN